MENQEKSNLVTQIIKEHGVVRRLSRGEYLFAEGDIADSLFYLESGLVKISRVVEDGQDITLFLRNPSELFGTAEVLAKTERQRYAKCLKASVVYELPAKKLFESSARQPEVGLYLCEILASRLLRTQQLVEELTTRSATWRLAWLLIQLAEKHGDELHVKVQLSHEELSNMIGCSRQTVSQTLNDWRDQQLLTYSREQILIFNADHFTSRLSLWRNRL